MQMKIKIKTPNGLAQDFTKGRRYAFICKLLGVRSLKGDTITVNKENNMLLWEFDADYKRYSSIIRNVALYDRLITGIFQSKMLQRVLSRYPLEDREELKHMLTNMTSIEVVKYDEQ